MPRLLPPILITALLVMTVIVIAQLHNDGRLKEKSFVEIMVLVLKQIVHLRSGAPTKVERALPEAAHAKEPLVPEHTGPRRIDPSRKPPPALPAAKGDTKAKKPRAKTK